MSRISSFPFSRLTQYAEIPDEDATVEIVVPEDVTTLSDEDLNALHTSAVEAFSALYGDGTELDSEMVTALSTLTEAIETLRAEQEVRAAASTERTEQAAALAARVTPLSAETDETDEAETDEADDEDEEDEDEKDSADDGAAEVTASVPTPRKEIRVNLGGVRSRQKQTPPRPASEARTMKDVVLASADSASHQPGTGMDWSDVGLAVDNRLRSFNRSAYEAAQRAGQHLSQTFGIATIRKPIAEEFMLDSNDPEHVDAVMASAVDESRLPGGSLVASGGWCAPSETVYDLLEMESRDGLFSLPEIGIRRGGLKFNRGPNFSAIMAAITGFDYSEGDDIAGTYAVDGDGIGTGEAGDKPCYHVPCPDDWTDVRLRTEGLCITAGLLQSRGYPEALARITRGALIAHDHRISARLIQSLVTGSDAVTMNTPQVGTTAPLLTSIELQVEHYKDNSRLARSTTLEAVFPFWVHGAVRADLSRRLGVDLIDVPDARINAWFAARGISPQFVYNWQGLSNPTGGSPVTSANAKAYPSTLKFLLYAAGTWVRGSADVISLDTMYDSINLGSNDFTALFTEEGYLVAKRGFDSRVITVPICSDGATHGGVDIACDGTLTPAA